MFTLLSSNFGYCLIVFDHILQLLSLKLPNDDGAKIEFSKKVVCNLSFITFLKKFNKTLIFIDIKFLTHKLYIYIIDNWKKSNTYFYLF